MHDVAELPLVAVGVVGVVIVVVVVVAGVVVVGVVVVAVVGGGVCSDVDGSVGNGIGNGSDSPAPALVSFFPLGSAAASLTGHSTEAASARSTMEEVVELGAYVVLVSVRSGRCRCCVCWVPPGLVTRGDGATTGFRPLRLVGGVIGSGVWCVRVHDIGEVMKEELRNLPQNRSSNF